MTPLPPPVYATGMAATSSSKTLLVKPPPELLTPPIATIQHCQESPVLVCSSAKMKPITRQSSTIFGLGSRITEVDSTITGSQVLRCLMFHLEEGANRTKWESAKIVLSKVAVFYEKANIPMISERKGCEKMVSLLDDNAKLRAIPCKRRSAPSTLIKVEQMEEKLAQTFPLWPVNVEKLMKNAEDLGFLQSMKSDRLATFGSHDKVLAGKIKRRHEREKLGATRQERTRVDMKFKTSSATSFDTSSSDEEHSTLGSVGLNADVSDNSATTSIKKVTEDNEGDYCAVGPSTSTHRSHHRTVRTGTTAFIPHDIIRRPKLVALATRLKMTPTQQASYTMALIAEVGGDPSKVATSYATADKSRRVVTQEISTTCKEQWIAPKQATLHWDSKLMPSLSNQNVTEERLTVVVGNTSELKLLAVPSYPSGTDKKSGDIIADITVGLLDSWHCADSIVNMAFDTTASNTGHVTAACVTIQKKLGRALLWSACRHHIGEVILSHVFDDLQIEVSKSPDVTLFTRFRKNFALLQSDDTTAPLARFDLNSINETAKGFIAQWRSNVLEISKAVIAQEKIRDDYLEFAKLCILFLDVPDSEVDRLEVDSDVANHEPIITFNFMRPGAVHKARWMAKLLYSIKISLFEHNIQQLPVGTITTKQQVLKVRDFVNFVTLIYSTWWMTCNSAVDAPWNDLKFYHSVLKYEDVQPVISRSAIRAFKNHLWYLTEEMVPLALWSNNVPEATRKALAERMLAVKPDTDVFTPQHRYGTGFGKPKFPSILTSLTTLAELVGPDSWFIFHLLQLDSQFLSEKVEEWSHSASYAVSKVKLQALNVVNDCAERGVKLSFDYLSSAKGEGHYQNVLQVVEENRKQHPNLRKRKSVQC